MASRGDGSNPVSLHGFGVPCECHVGYSHYERLLDAHHSKRGWILHYVEIFTLSSMPAVKTEESRAVFSPNEHVAIQSPFSPEA